MPWTEEHMKWMVNTGKLLKTAEGKDVEIWNFVHKKDDAVLSAWGKHFRNHYCFDNEIERLRSGTNYSRTEYLKKLKFPDQTLRPGPSIRAGDFAEILIADFLQFQLDYWVPKTRYGDKNIRNESTKGSDIIGFFLQRMGNILQRTSLLFLRPKHNFQ